MSLLDISKINIALKKLMGRAHTNNSKDPSNEAESSNLNILANQVWVDTIEIPKLISAKCATTADNRTIMVKDLVGLNSSPVAVGFVTTAFTAR